MSGDTLRVGSVTITAVKDLPRMPSNPLVLYPKPRKENVQGYEKGGRFRCGRLQNYYLVKSRGFVSRFLRLPTCRKPGGGLM